MRMKTMIAIGWAARWILRILDVRVPMSAAYGLRIR
jgi:hypothetical protein